MKKSLIIVMLATLLLTGLAHSAPPVAAQVSQPEQNENLENGGWEFRRSWGGEGSNLEGTGRLAIFNQEKLHLIQRGKCRLTIFDTKNETYNVIDVTKNIDTCVKLGDLAIDPNGFIYVSSYHPGQVIQYTADGRFIKSFREVGDGDNSIFLPDAMTVDKSGLLYISDYTRVLVFNSNGEIVRKWDTKIGGNGEAFRPGSIATDSQGGIYVKDFDNDKIHKYDYYGNYLYYLDPCFQEENCGSSNLVTSPDDSILVQIHENKIVRFSNQGTFLGLHYENNSGYFSDFDIDKNGVIYTIVSGEMIEKVSSSGTKVAEWKTTYDNFSFGYPIALEITSDGRILVSDKDRHCIQVFDPDGSFLFSIGGFGTIDGKFNNPIGLFIDANNQLYVADTGNNRVQKFSPDFSHLSSFPLGIDEWFRDVAVDDAGNIYALLDQKVLKLDPNGVLIETWYVEEYTQTINIVNSKVYLCGFEALREYTLDGVLVREIGFEVNGTHVGGMTVDHQNRLYLAIEEHFYPFNNYIAVFDYAGNFLYKIGSSGSMPGKFFGLKDIKIHENMIYVLEQRSSRVQVFSLGFPTPDSYSGFSQNGSFERNPSLTEWTYGGEQPVTHVHNATHGQRSLLLGRAVAERVPQGQNKAFAYSNFYVDPNMVRPVLTFDYNMFVNDIKDYSDFFVEVQDGVGLNHLATVVHDGFSPCTPGLAPSPGRNLGWRSAHLDLTPYKGQHIRIVFSNRNRWPGAWGMWTYVDNVRVLDHGYLPQPPGPYRLRMPVVLANRCDPVGKGSDEIYRQLPLVE